MLDKAKKQGWRQVKFGDVVRQVKERVDPETSGLERYVAGTVLAWSRAGRPCTATLPALQTGALRVGPLVCTATESTP